MILFPKEQPVIENLNSYYIDIIKLFEHCQGELGAGGIHFRSKGREAIFYFDSNDWLNGAYESAGTILVGPQAREGILNDVREFNFNLRVYRLDAERVYFWANLPYAVPVYSNLSTEFTNLAALIKKLRAEKLTGAVDVGFPDTEHGGILFFNSGQLVGGSYSWSNGADPSSQEDLRRLLERSQNKTAVFNVCKIPTDKPAAAANENRPENKVPPSAAFDPITAAENLLQAFDTVITAQSKILMDSSTLLRRKYVGKIDQYPFLDPFAGELEYTDRRLRYSGQEDPADVLRAITETVQELTGELKLNSPLPNELQSWKDRYQDEIKRLGLSL